MEFQIKLSKRIKNFLALSYLAEILFIASNFQKNKAAIKLKFNINNILPILLALILPGISIYSNIEGDTPQGNFIYYAWTVTSALLYNIWYFLWNLWDLKSRIKHRKYQIILILLMLGIVGFIFFILQFSNEEFRPIYLIRFIFIAFLFLAIQYALRAQNNIAQLQLEKEQIQTENYRTQLKALQTQVDPHFLFNSLNTLRAMVRQKHGKAEQFVMSLGDFYRQTLKHTENTTLQLSKELEVLQSYLFLMKSRNEGAVRIDINIEESLYAYKLPTLALQTVVENCFKHNSMSSKMPLHIEISNINGYIQVSNNIQPKFGQETSSGYGLKLLKKRYALMNIAQGVIIEQTPNQFKVQLKLIK